jgi:hypothetical protein
MYLIGRVLFYCLFTPVNIYGEAGWCPGVLTLHLTRIYTYVGVFGLFLPSFQTGLFISIELMFIPIAIFLLWTDLVMTGISNTRKPKLVEREFN